MSLSKGEAAGRIMGGTPLTWFFSAIFVIAALVLCQQIISNSLADQRHKNDYAELNHVKYGLFSNVDKKVRESNSGSARGWVKQSLMSIFGGSQCC